MATVDEVRASADAGERWYALDPADVAARLRVDPAEGLGAARAAELLAKNGPNALPVEQPPSAIRRFLAEYTSYMQIILVGAAIVSLVIQQWATAIVLAIITLFNALVGLRLVRLDGGWAGPVPALVRTVLLCLVVPPLVYDRDQRGLHDRLARTVLVRR